MHLSFVFIIWALLSIFMIGTLDLLSFSLKRTGWQRLIFTFLFFYTQIIVSEFVLGMFSVLTGKSLVALNLIFSAGLLVFLEKKSKGTLTKSYTKSFKGTTTDLKQKVLRDPFLLVLVTLAAIFVVWVIFLGVIFPATDFDGNSYHLTFIGNVLQYHNFFDTPTSLRWLSGYPKGGEFIQMWSVIITRNDMFTDIAQIPFLGLGVYALYEIARTVGISKRSARFSAIMFIFLPVVLNQLKTTYVDVMLCALFFASIAMVIQKKLSNLDLLLLGIIYSLIVSIKSTGLLFIVATVPLLLFNLYQNRSRKKNAYVASYIRPLAHVAIPMVFGLYWYIKNWVVYGSPIYPFGFKMMGTHIFPGQTFQEFAANAVGNLQALPKGCASRVWFVWTEQKDWYGCFYNYDTNYAGLGPIWFVLLIPSTLMAMYLLIKQRRYQFLAVLATILGLFAIYPANYYSRYTMFVTAIGILSLGFVLDHLSVTYVRVVKVIAIVLTISVIATNFVLCNFPPLVIKAQLQNLGANSSRGPVYSNNPGKAYVFIESKLKPSDLVVYDSSPYFIYPLWRSDFKNRVEYIPSANKREWLNKLQAKSTDYVFTTVWSKEHRWASESLHSIYKDEMYEVYQVN